MNKLKDYDKVMESRFPPTLFALFFGVLLLMSGIHVGLIVMMNRMTLGPIIQILIPLIYWALVALWLTLLTRKQMKATYEEPMQSLAKAATAVANGDFSVYIPPLHTSDKHDYLDMMILDFNKMVEELGSIETLKTDFVSNVSHEMKTPLAIIKNYSELLQADNVTEERRKEYAHSMEEACRRLSNLISNILKLNKLENQRIIPEVESYNVCRQLCDCILQFEEIWEEKEIELEVDIEDSAMIKADESLLELVWNNLLSNAMKFTETGGMVKVRQVTKDHWVSVSVSDTGCGMSLESTKHIFDKFYQGDTSHSKEGNGLGLALVKRVLELLDGNIRVESEEGKGSTFTVTLPIDKNKDTDRGDL